MKSLLPLLLLLALTEALPPWTGKLIPKVSISRASNKPCTRLITPDEMKRIPQHLHEELRLIQSDLCENEHRMTEYATDIDELIAQVFSLRSRAETPSKDEFQAQIRAIIDRAHDSLASSRPRATSKGKTSTKISPSTLNTKYNECVKNYFGPNHVEQWKTDLLQSISSHAVKMEEFKAKLLSAERADLARVHAHRMKCFAAIEERIKSEETTTDSGEKFTRSSTEKEELDKNFKIIDENLEKAEKDLAEWRTRQSEIVKHLFHDLLNQKSQTAVLQSQEDRLNALVLLAHTEQIDAQKARDQFPVYISDVEKLHPGVQKMMKEYSSCLSSQQLQWSSELRRELMKHTNSFSGKTETSDMAVQRAKFKYFWGRHLIRIHLDFANALARSVHCFATTERDFFYKDAHVK